MKLKSFVKRILSITTEEAHSNPAVEVISGGVPYLYGHLDIKEWNIKKFERIEINTEEDELDYALIKEVEQFARQHGFYLAYIGVFFPTTTIWLVFSREEGESETEDR